ncbi:hypothetical protein [Halorussus salinisoli]|uniref:hypothetical protein n=1 Tax=Halorussus salinisoli TaxID=2558242 RepID=UPI0010C1BAEA|nr:hypothetical protein [Halorussus salinisoli]
MPENQQNRRSDDRTTDTGHTRRTILKNAALGAAVFGLGLPAMTAGVTAKNGVQRFSFDLTGFQLFVPCVGETLEATQGTLEVQVHQQTDAAGGIHFVLRQKIRDAELVGLDSGTTYRAVGGATQSTQARPPYPQVLTSNVRERWVSPGPAPNIAFDTTFKLRVNANGEVVLLSVEDTTECR